MSSAPQRRFVRKPVNVSFQGSDGTGQGQLIFTSADLSEGGTFITSDLLLDDGEPLELAFALPGGSRQLKARAKVVWVRRFPHAEEPAGMGIEFVDFNKGDREALREYLERA